MSLGAVMWGDPLRVVPPRAARATNACLSELERKERRVLPVEIVRASRSPAISL